ncbi:DUF3040 domain-containing protein [Brevibacterium samyangense]|uniref:DUF3040 domain-containing protein n=1 Tax=Brevibacterium samyangense TaxID=366888 RepID=A0ABN2TD89_9MICO
MPLSDHEQQLLDELEKQLRSEDPRFAQNISQPRPTAAGGSVSAKRFVGGVLGVIAGVAVAIGSIWIIGMPWGVIGGVLGFAIMVGAGFWAMSGDRGSASEGAGPNASKDGGRGTPGRGPSSPSGSAPKQGPGFMDRMEDRWERRRRGE